MGRGLAARAPACADHPHRPAKDRCDGCGRGMCAECVVPDGRDLLCVACKEADAAAEREAQEEAALSRLGRLRKRLTQNRASAIAVAIIVVVLALEALAAGVQVAGATWRQQAAGAVGRVAQVNRSPAEAARDGGSVGGRVAPTPTADTPRVETVLRVAPRAVQSGQAAGALGVNVGALTDGVLGGRAAAWRTLAGSVTAELYFPIPEAPAVTRVVFGHSAALPREAWAQVVEVWLSTEEGDPQGALAGRYRLAQTVDAQSFAIPRTVVRGARLVVLENYGSGEYSSLAEFALTAG